MTMNRAFDAAKAPVRAPSRLSPTAAFTLIELLVVVAVVGVLVSLLVPAVAYGRFRARVTTCTGNYRQLAIATVLYADTDPRNRLPSFSLPTESSQLANFRSLCPWLVGLPTFAALEAHGATDPRLWFCPTRTRWRFYDRTHRAVVGSPLTTISNLTHFYRSIQGAPYAFPDLNWWIPRPLEGAPHLTYPDPTLVNTRLPTPWPTRTDDPNSTLRPFATDWMAGTRRKDSDGFKTAGGAHAFGGRIRSCNAAFLDGHVETRPAPALRWELQLNGTDVTHVFY